MLAEQIRGARAILRMEQSELAELAGVSVPTIRRIEAMDGPIKGVRQGTLQAIEDVLGMKGVTFGFDDIGPTISIHTPDEKMDEIFDAVGVIFPEYTSWFWKGDRSEGYDFRGEGPDGILFVCIKAGPIKSDMELDDLRRLRIKHRRARLAFIVIGGLFDGQTSDGIQILAYPRPAEFDILDDEDLNLIG